jgi:spore coat polysaccharide biosynthesis predicted glycosyltransferase SpsG
MHVVNAGIEIARVAAPHPAAGDLEDTIRVIRRTEASVVVLDGYHFQQEYLDGIRAAGVSTAVIDDLPRMPDYGCDLLIDQNIGALTKSYPPGSAGTILFTPRFSILRPEFRAEGRHGTAPEAAVRVLVLAGGSDPADATNLVLSALEPDQHAFEITIVIGGANPRADAIRRRCARLGRVTVLENVKDLRPAMIAADLAIATVGGTMWELARCGVPTLLLSATDAHTELAASAHAYGAHQWLGDARAVSKGDVRDAVLRLAGDWTAREGMRVLGQRLVDGHGADRVAEALSTIGDSWDVRPAGVEDVEAAWELERPRTHQPREAVSYPAFESEFVPRRYWVLSRRGGVGALVRYDAHERWLEATIAAAPPLRLLPAIAQLIRESSAEAYRQSGVGAIRAMVDLADEWLVAALHDAGFARRRDASPGRGGVVFEHALNGIVESVVGHG